MYIKPKHASLYEEAGYDYSKLISQLQGKVF